MFILLAILTVVCYNYVIITHEGRMGSGKTMSCVPAGTSIATASGQRNIEEIQVKDLVLSYNVRSKVRELRRVSNIFVRESTSLVAIFLDNGVKLQCTVEHPVFVEKFGWREAGDLHGYMGKRVLGIDNNPRITDVIYISGKKEKVYNLEVEINNNYFANDILVHNCTAFAYNEWLKGKRVIANYQLAFVEHFIKTCRDPQVQDVEDVQRIYGLEPPDTFSLDYFVEHLTDKEIYNCLPAGAEITAKNPDYQPRKEDGTRDGHGSVIQRNIEDIQVGDEVLSFSEKTREKEFKKVVHVFNTRTSWVFINLRFSNGNHIRCTPGHPIYLSDGTTKQASEIKEGDRVIQYRYSGLNLRCTKGKKYEEIYGEENGRRLKKEKVDLMTGRSYSECMTSEMEEKTRKKKSETMIETWKTSEGLNGEERSRKISEKLVGDPERSARSKRNADAGISGFKRARELGVLPTFADHWKNPKSAEKLRKHVEKHTADLLHLICPTKLEIELGKILDEKFPGKWEYTGDGKVWFNGCNPDFVFSGSNKVLEVFTEYHKIRDFGSVENYIRVRAEKLAVAGKESLFIVDEELNDLPFLLNKIETFMFNPRVEIVTVTSSIVETLDRPEKVYDIEVEDNHNIYVHGILMRQSYLIFDEAYLYMDSRNTATRMNKLFSWFLAQTRKRGVDLAICFPKNTKILSEKKIRFKNQYNSEGYYDGLVTRNIEDIEVGDKVLSFSEKTGKKEMKVVRKVYENEGNDFITVKFSNGNEIRCTSEHPIAVNDKGKIRWISASSLSIDDECIQFLDHSVNLRIYNINKRNKTWEQQYGQEKTVILKDKKRQYVQDNWIDNNEKLHRGNETLRLQRTGKKNTQIYGESRANEINLKRWSEVRRKENAIHMANKMMKFSTVGSSKIEKRLFDIIDEIAPGFFVHNYKGGYQKKIGIMFDGRIPDIISLDRKKIIEMDGCYWHGCSECGHYNERKVSSNVKREKIYRELGYDCLAIWGHELKNKDLLIAKIKNFIFNPKVEIVKVVDIVRDSKREKVYNLEVEDNNNYFAHGILVHNCVGENTSIITPEGYRKIQDIRVGDSVFSFSADLQQEFQKVLRVYEKPAKEIISLNFSDGSHLNCTPEHPLLNLNRDTWTEAQYLKSGDKCFHSYRNDVYVDKKETSFFEGKVYNLEVEKNNNYFANNILTHNCTIHYDHLDKRLRRAVTLRVLCFPGSVKVLMEDENKNIIHRNISDIRVGDRVLSHGKFGDNEFRKVTEVHVRRTREIWTLRFSSDKEVKCTPEHPFFVGGSWIRAQDLRIGDTCLSYSDGPIRFKGYGTSYYSDLDVYNLEVEKNHNYFANDVLVHNCRYNERRKVVTSRMIDLKSGNRNTIHLYAPDFWDLYDTREIIDVPAGQVYLPDSLSISGKKQ